jgi:hypothetical protein
VSHEIFQVTDTKTRYRWFRLAWGMLSAYVLVCLYWMALVVWWPDLHELSTGLADISVSTIFRIAALVGCAGCALLASVAPTKLIQALAIVALMLLLGTGGTPSIAVAATLFLLSWFVQRELGVEAPRIPTSGCCLGPLLVMPFFWSFFLYAVPAFVLFQAIRCFPWLVLQWPPLLDVATDMPDGSEIQVVAEPLLGELAATEASSDEEEWEFDG